MRFSIPTSASREQAFAAIADFGRLDEWEPTVARSDWTDGSWPTVGSKVRLSTKPWVGGADLVYTLESLEPGRRAQYRGGTERIRSIDTITCTDRPTGTVVVIETDIETLGRLSPFAPAVRLGLAALGSSIITPMLRRRLERLS